MWFNSIRDLGAPSRAPAPAFLGGDPRMTRLAQRHEIAFVMGAAIGQRDHVVYFLRRRDPALAPAYLAERMRCHMPAPNRWPHAVVPFLHFRCSTMAIVLGCDQLLVHRTIQSIRKLRAAGIAAGLLRLSRHTFLQYKRPPRFLTMALPIILDSIHYLIGGYSTSSLLGLYSNSTLTLLNYTRHGRSQ